MERFDVQKGDKGSGVKGLREKGSGVLGYSDNRFCVQGSSEKGSI